MTHDMSELIKVVVAAACILTAGCSVVAKDTVPTPALITVNEQKSAYLEKVKHLDCVQAGVVDSGCYQMKRAAKEGFDDAFVEISSGVFVLDAIKLEYLKGLDARLDLHKE